MVRKSKQAGGNMPLTHYERTQKFSASSNYGTTSRRLAGHAQYQLGTCALTVVKLNDDDTNVLCSPSGYLYSESAILEYLLKQTREIKEKKVQLETRQKQREAKSEIQQEKKRLADFAESQKIVKKKTKTTSESSTAAASEADNDSNAKSTAKADLKRVSYWLADSQPKVADAAINDVSSIPDRPSSPMTGQPLRRKDLWPISLEFDNDKLICSSTHKTIQSNQGTVAYWTDKKQPGKIVLESFYDDVIAANAANPRCPLSDQKIKYTRRLQKSGSSFASSEQGVQVQQYRPTIT